MLLVFVAAAHFDGDEVVVVHPHKLLLALHELWLQMRINLGLGLETLYCQELLLPTTDQPRPSASFAA